jgi:hypothetical protein
MDLHPFAKKSAPDYVKALLEAAAKLKADPIKILTETAEVPKIKTIDMVEFLVGWFHGVAEAQGVKVERLWAELVAAHGPRPKPYRAPKGVATCTARGLR